MESLPSIKIQVSTQQNSSCSQLTVLKNLASCFLSLAVCRAILVPYYFSDRIHRLSMASWWWYRGCCPPPVFHTEMAFQWSTKNPQKLLSITLPNKSGSLFYYFFSPDQLCWYLVTYLGKYSFLMGRVELIVIFLFKWKSPKNPLGKRIKKWNCFPFFFFFVGNFHLFCEVALRENKRMDFKNFLLVPSFWL